MIVGAASSWRFRAGSGSLGCRASLSLRCSLLVSHARAMPVEAAWAAAKTSGPLHAFFVRARAKHVAAEFLLFDDWFDAIEDSRENRELRQANEILRKASAYFAQAELDRRYKP